MFGLIRRKSFITVVTSSCFIHLQADRQMDGRTDGQIDLFQMYRSIIQSLYYFYFADLV